MGSGGLLVVVGVVVAMEDLLAGAGLDAEDDGVAELGGGGAAFVFGADLVGRGLSERVRLNGGGVGA